MIGFDPLYFLMLGPALLLSIYAQLRVKSAYAKYRDMPNTGNRSGREVAEQLLRTRNLDVQIEEVSGWLSDHYDPSARTLRLSPDVYHGRSVTAAGIAAHEAGHALQHAEGYFPMHVRQTMAPVTMVASNLSFVVIFLGFIMSAMGLIKLGILAFTLVVVFQIVTLPVEFNASSRAKILLGQYNIVSGDAAKGVAKVLDAAALTYVAAALSSILTLVYYLFRAGLLGGRSDD
ncbi:MAG: hypothetical protein A2284_06975 [Deltaproteobacteria bacterium RIFOXYA12_FULL_61_11]|nr:MAG: hypothetical protein A2284_06975 [Deltaproteobacteria bacterium RIFOXYA12_FULL_61_11]